MYYNHHFFFFILQNWTQKNWKYQSMLLMVKVNVILCFQFCVFVFGLHTWICTLHIIKNSTRKVISDWKKKHQYYHIIWGVKCGQSGLDMSIIFYCCFLSSFSDYILESGLKITVPDIWGVEPLSFASEEPICFPFSSNLPRVN